MTGYSSQHLARHFRHHLGCSPREYRRLNGHWLLAFRRKRRSITARSDTH